MTVCVCSRVNMMLCARLYDGVRGSLFVPALNERHGWRTLGSSSGAKRKAAGRRASTVAAANGIRPPDEQPPPVPYRKDARVEAARGERFGGAGCV